MIGKIVGVLLILGLIILGIMWISSGESLTDFIKDLTGSSGNDLSSSNADNLLYAYHITMGKPYNSEYKFNVLLHVIKRTSNSLCYNYEVREIKLGDPDFIHGFMNSYQDAGEDEPICTDLDTNNPNPKYYFASPDTTMTQSSTNGETRVNYRYVNGLLKSLDMKYMVYINGTNVPVSLEVKLIGEENTATYTTTTQPEAGTNKVHIAVSSANVSWIKYRFTWNVPIYDLVTNKTNGTMTIIYDILVEIVSRSGSGVCLKYSITNVSRGTINEAHDYMVNYFAGYDEGKSVCININNDSPEQIPYYLFNPSITDTRKLSGDGYNGVVEITNGILSNLQLTYDATIEDENNHTIAVVPIAISVTLLDAGA